MKIEKRSGYLKKEINKEFKVYFLIFNLIFATIAFSCLVSAQDDAAKITATTALLNMFSSWGGNTKPSPPTTPVPASQPGASSSPAVVISQAATASPATTNPSPVGITKTPIQTIETQPVNLPASQYYEEFVKAHPNAEALARSFGYGKEWDQWKARAYSKTATTSATTNPSAVANPPTTTAPTISQSPTVGGTITDYFHNNLMDNLKITAIGAGAGMLIGYLSGGKNGWLYGGLAGGAGMFSYQILKKMMPGSTWIPIIGGLGVAAAIFLLTFKKEKNQTVEFQCLPWQAPVGGSDCEKCNDYPECSEYTCKSLGQACDLVNVGSKNQSCVWKNPYDVNSPTIEMTTVTKGHHFIPDNTIRPPATGVEVLIDGGKCIKAFTPLDFSFKTNEPAQCRIDYNITSDAKTGYDSMGYYVGGNQEYSYNHSEQLSLPGPDAINKIAPELKNDGTYTLYIRCEDANGNFNVNPFSVRFCVQPGPDTTPPEIVNVSIPSGSPVQFNRTNILIEVYVNEPADCKWSKEDRAYANMEGNMSCDNNLWDMNYDETYTCRAKLTGIEDRTENLFYFRCLDKPNFPENERNLNKQSYLYSLTGTEPLNILKIEPDNTVSGATDMIPVNLSIKTDNGYNNGEAICYFSTTGKESDYIEFSTTGGNEHMQRQDLIPGNYSYYYKCVDLGGNTVYNSTNFLVESDRSMPIAIRMDKENGELRIVTDKESLCSYSYLNCNFEIDDGIRFSTVDNIFHFAEWKTSSNYYVRCKDNNNNQPDPNVCTIIVRPIDLFARGTAIVL